MMNFLKEVLMFELESAPTSWGLFHIGAWVITILFTVFISLFFKKDDKKYRILIASFGFILILFEIYKLTIFSVNWNDDGTITWDFPWYAFPFQFCSTPLYVFPLVGLLPDSKFRDALKAFLSTYMLVASLAVMIYPGDVFVEFLGIDIQTMMVHGSMLAFGLNSLITKKIEFKFKTLIDAALIFLMFVSIALILDVSFVKLSGLTDTFNMYFISPYFPSTLPILSIIDEKAPYILTLISYLFAFTFASFTVLEVSALLSRTNGRKHKS